MRWIVTVVVAGGVWLLMAHATGGVAVPFPTETAAELRSLLVESATWRHAALTLYRGTAGLALGFVAALAVGVPCGLSRRLMNSLSPFVFAAQGCPTILWISLLMVWVGSGSLVPMAAVFLATAPVLFFNVAEGTAALDRRLFQMARLYRVATIRVVRRIVLPGLRAPILAGLSFALAVAWKVAVTAEFIAAGSGVGSQIYWAYRLLKMPRLFAWAALVMGWGMLIEAQVVRPLRKVSEGRSYGGAC